MFSVTTSTLLGNEFLTPFSMPCKNTALPARDASKGSRSKTRLVGAVS